jgi:hypothetical protein
VGVSVGSGVDVGTALGLGLGVLVAAATFSAVSVGSDVGVRSAGGLPPQAVSQSSPTASTITAPAGKYRPNILHNQVSIIRYSPTIILMICPQLAVTFSTLNGVD